MRQRDLIPTLDFRLERSPKSSDDELRGVRDDVGEVVNAGFRETYLALDELVDLTRRSYLRDRSLVGHATPDALQGRPCETPSALCWDVGTWRQRGSPSSPTHSFLKTPFELV